MVTRRFGDARTAWLLALLLYGVGDSVTTILGLATPGVAEGSPVTLALLDAGGVPAFLAVKVGFLAAAYLAWAWLDTPGRRAIPLALVVVGAGVTLWNAATLVV